MTATLPGASNSGSVPAVWTATDNDLIIPVAQLAGGTAPAPYAITDSEAGIVANRASGFQGAYEVFDLGKPGVGYGKSTITAADGDTLVWGTDLIATTIVDVSVDGSTWISVYSATASQQAVMVLSSFAAVADPVGTFSQYSLFTPRAIRFSVVIIDAVSGLIYAGPRNPTLTYTFAYAAG